MTQNYKLTCEPNDLMVLIPKMEILRDNYFAFPVASTLTVCLEKLGYKLIDYGERHEFHIEMWFRKES